MESEEILRGVLDRWKAGIDAHEPQQAAELFTPNAIFQGLRPYSVGHRGVANYYAGQPRGMSVSYWLLETRSPAADLVLGYLGADFSFPDRPTVSLHLGVLVEHGNDGWQIVYYQASRPAA